MARSFRLKPELERQLELAARAKGVSVSALIREAVTRHCEEILARNLKRDLAEVIGAIETSGGRARRTGEAFREILASRSPNSAK
jgi:predicted DNA-binding protein